MTLVIPTIPKVRTKNIPIAPRLGGPFTYWNKREKSLAKSQHEYSSLQLVLPESLRKQITDWATENIPEFHLGPGGIEFCPHITLKYGLKDSSEETIQSLRNLLAKQGPFSVKLGRFNAFKSDYGKWDNKDGDVLYIEVNGIPLHNLNKIITENFDCENTHPNYIPHVTVAYLKPEYIDGCVSQELPFQNQEVVFESVEWSGADGRKEVIPFSFLASRGIKGTFSGRKRDSLGRVICFSSGRRIECGTRNRPALGIRSTSTTTRGYTPTGGVRTSKVRAISGIIPDTPLPDQSVRGIGYRIILTWLKSKGYSDAHYLSVEGGNFQKNIIHSHEIVEAKVGQVSDDPNSKKWKMLSEKPSEKEREWFQSASEEDRVEWLKMKKEMIFKKKLQVLEEIENQIGHKLSRKTVGAIINPDKMIADIFVLDGFHTELDWDSDLVKDAYIESVEYGDKSDQSESKKEFFYYQRKALNPPSIKPLKPQVPQPNPEEGTTSQYRGRPCPPHVTTQKTGCIKEEDEAKEELTPFNLSAFDTSIGMDYGEQESEEVYPIDEESMEEGEYIEPEAEQVQTTSPELDELEGLSESEDEPLVPEKIEEEELPQEKEEIPQEEKLEEEPISFPDDLNDLKEIQNLGGSTGAKLVEDQDGNQFVLKSGQKNPDHLKEEFNADEAYRALGIDVPSSKLYETAEGPKKLAEFIDGTLLRDVENKEDFDKVEDVLRKGFVADCLLGNWDVVGLEDDNVLLGKDGNVYRLDNGGALRFRAQGEPKGDKWGEEVNEIDTLRDEEMNPSSARMFSGISDEEIKQQVRGILNNKEKLLAVLPKDVAEVVEKRLSWLEEKYPRSEIPSYVGQSISKAYQIPDHIKHHTKEWKSKITPEQRSSIREYTETSYQNLNMAMRSCPPEFKCLDKAQQQMYQHIEEVIEKAGRFEEPITVYRGISYLPHVVKTEFLKNAREFLKSGRDYKMPSLTSTSLDPITGLKGFSVEESVAFRIQAKSGIDVSGISAYDEKEIIQSAKTKYKVVGVEEVRVVLPYAADETRSIVYLEEI